jgi:DNA (cytosine-5)-methyltransferase 1
MVKKGLNYISLFSSAGVGCHGFKQERFNCILTNELIPRRLEVQKANEKCKSLSGYIPGDILLEDVQERIYKEIDSWKSREGLKDVDVLIATPPCQGMSVANHKKKDELPRNSLIIESLKITKEILPKFFVFENVRAFLKSACLDVDGKVKSISEAIEKNLGGHYNLSSKIINFKEYGCPSSRTRTLVIGVRKDLRDISPYDLFPEEENTKTIREVIGHLPELKEMGEISKDDIFHTFRNYDPRMLPWIENLPEGKSAFSNEDPLRRPHRIIGGVLVKNSNKNGDKYRRCTWDQNPPCIHTRNDILASQSTIHPRDNRVFSVRELMEFMTVPKDFRWSFEDLEFLNSLSYVEKGNYLKKHEINIRQSLGEAVPTIILRKIAGKIRNYLENKKLSAKEIQDIIQDNNLSDVSNLHQYIKKSKDRSFVELSKISELANSKRLETSAYYTSQDMVFSMVKDLPEWEDKKKLRILEPSGGCGNFIPQIIKKYAHIPKVLIDIVDIDKETIETLKVLLKKLNIPKNFSINLINDDFLLHPFKERYDLVIGNPPFKKITGNKKRLEEYKRGMYNGKTNNIFSFFIEKSALVGDIVSLITPKSLLSTPELSLTREFMEEKGISKICDYGEFGFDVKIETISFIMGLRTSYVKVESYIRKEIRHLARDYLFDNVHPYWIIYRDSFFDKVRTGLKLDVFNVFRDRQITTKTAKTKGKYKVLRSRNLTRDGKIESIDGYDLFLDNLEGIAISKFMNKDIFIAPNLSYYPRMGYLPKETVVDGSLALLIPKDHVEVAEIDPDYYSTEEFTSFYRIVCNYGTRSLNLNKNIIYFWGVKN